MTNLPTIAASLSDAQKRAVRNASYGWFGLSGSLMVHDRPSTRGALVRRGICKSYGALTDLGKEVRRHLLKEGESSDG